MRGKRGLYIAVESIDGSGKSRLVQALRRALEGVWPEGIVVVREPHLPATRLLFRRGLPPLGEFFLFNADRNALFREVVGPALAEGKLVLSDRSYLSSLAYQVPLLDLEEAEAERLCLKATGGIRPTLWFLLDLPPEEAWERTRHRPQGEEAFLRERLQRVRERYLELAAKDPRGVVLDARLPPVKLLGEALGKLEGLLWFKGKEAGL